MPRHPDVAPDIAAMPRGVFSTVAHRIAALDGEVFPLHIGDTWLEPPQGCRLDDLDTTAVRGQHRYAPPRGLPVLLDAVAERRGVDRERIIVTAGATGALSAALGAILAPGEEVLLLAPYWPLIRGIVQTRHGVPVDVPFFADPAGGDAVIDAADPAAAVAAALAAARSERTVAVYLNTPNNPTGRVLSREVLDAVVAFARAHDLWILADEVYEDLAWARPHLSLADLAPERTLAAWSFSKAYGMAGNRVGYLVGPPAPSIVPEARKVAMHGWYAAPAGPQRNAAEALRCGDPWLARASAAYREAGEAAAARLGLPPPEGGTFLFLDVAEQLDDRGMQGFLERCIDHHLLVAPGEAFGRDYAGFVRLCFTSARPEVVARGVEVLAALTGR